MRHITRVFALLCAIVLAGCSTASSCGYGRICAPSWGTPLPPDTPYVPQAQSAPYSSLAPAARGQEPEPETFPVQRGGTASIVQAIGAQPAAQTRLALLLPLQSPALGPAAAAVRDGFMAAWEREPGGVQVTTFDTTDAPDNVLQLYDQAQASHDVVVGPLLRQAVTALAQSGRVAKPTLALNQPESQANGDPADIVLPPNLLLMGLSVEDEARQAARWAATDHAGASAHAVYGHSSWQRRAARAFAAQRLAQGLPTTLVQIAANPGDARNTDMVKVQDGLSAEPGSVLFVALDPEAARDLRRVVGPTVPIYATSQLNPNVLTAAAEPLPDLDGVRLFDLPWQLQNDHAAAMTYPRPAIAADARPNADLARLYALGIDAYRVARAIALGAQLPLELDGVTGKISVRQDGGAYRFERAALPAVYRDGVARPWPGR